VSDDALDCEVVTTRGGAQAMLDRKTGEVMHPGVGPVAEANALYVGPSRLRERLESPGTGPLVLLDVGLGAGSNAAAALTLSAALSEGARALEIVSFDRSVAALRLALDPRHAQAFGHDLAVREAGLTLLAGGHAAQRSARWRLVLGALPQAFASEPSGLAEVVFWDPFSPRQNPELWSVSAFVALRRLCAPSVTVHTYSSATATRSALLLAGFAVGFGPAAGDKQATTTVAALDPSRLEQPLDARWLARLARSSAPFPPDAPDDALARISALPQFGAG
jgi:queuine tRNA-ribosyltransferase